MTRRHRARAGASSTSSAAAASSSGEHEAAATSGPRGPRPTPRGWPGRGGGRSLLVQAADEWRGTTVQVCGLWPWGTGGGSPMLGVPLGPNLLTGTALCCDPITWFQQADLISNPSVFVLGRPGLGKSTLVRRMALGLTGFGVLPLILGDLKPDYVDLIEAVGGQVIRLGRGRGHLNILDPGEATRAADRLTGSRRREVMADAHGRRHAMVSALITIMRAAPPDDREETILDRALRVLDDKHDRHTSHSARLAGAGVPVLADLLQVIRDAPEEVRQVALDRGHLDRYHQITEGLEATLIGLVGGGRLGEIFAAPTSTPMRRDRPVVFDVSSVDDAQMDLQAAVLLACWSYGFGAVNIAHTLADAGLEPRRHYFVILDELWRALRAGSGMVDRVDALTRLNRQRGVGLAMISHTMSDLLSLPAEADRMKARGFVERAGMVIAGGLPAAEMPMLTQVVPLSRAEQQMLISWQDPPSWDPVAGAETEPPGRGKFLVKVGTTPGWPVHVTLTSVEAALNDTNKLWHQHSRAGRLADLEPAPDPHQADDTPTDDAGDTGDTLPRGIPIAAVSTGDGQGGGVGGPHAAPGGRRHRRERSARPAWAMPPIPTAPPSTPQPPESDGSSGPAGGWAP